MYSAGGDDVVGSLQYKWDEQIDGYYLRLAQPARGANLGGWVINN